MNEIERISEEIIDLEDRLSSCLEYDQLDDVSHYQDEIDRLTAKLTRLEKTERKAKPNNSKGLF